MNTVIVIASIIAVLVVTSFIIHKFFPQWKKFEPLMLVFELLSMLTMFID